MSLSLFCIDFVYRTVVYEPDSLRGSFGLTDTRNGFHGSGEVTCLTDEGPITTCLVPDWPTVNAGVFYT